MWKISHRSVDACFNVALACKTAGRNEAVNMRQTALQQTAVTPQLRRATMRDGTRKAARLDAGFAIEFIKHVGGTNQPVFMQRVKLERITIGKNGRATDQ